MLTLAVVSAFASQPTLDTAPDRFLPEVFPPGVTLAEPSLQADLHGRDRLKLQARVTRGQALGRILAVASLGASTLSLAGLLHTGDPTLLFVGASVAPPLALAGGAFAWDGALAARRLGRDVQPWGGGVATGLGGLAVAGQISTFSVLRSEVRTHASQSAVLFGGIVAILAPPASAIATLAQADATDRGQDLEIRPSPSQTTRGTPLLGLSGRF